MSDYTITTNFGAKDSLPSNDAGKVIKGSEFTTEFTNIQTAVATKADTAGDTFTGVVNFSNDIAVNTNTLFVDVSTAKVGIGTTSPAYPLDVTGSAQLSGGDLILRSDSTDADTQSIRFENVGDDDRSAYIRADFENNESGNGIGLAFGTNDSGQDGQTRMVLTRIGRVGIGTTSPDRPLDITDATTDGTGGAVIHSYLPTLELDNILGSGTSFILQHNFTSTLFKHDTTELMRFTAAGNLLIGKNSENSINTQGVEIYQDGRLYVTATNKNVVTLNRTETNGVIMHFHKNGIASGNISVTASSTSYNTSSDERLKENITDSTDAGSRVDAIQIRQFDWKADGSHQDYGVIAQELVEVAPEAVSEGDTEEDMMGVDYSKLVPMLIKEVQSLRSRVAELENV